MGHRTAQDIADQVGGGITLEAAIGWHLSGNFYPPLPGDYVAPLREAMDAVLEDEPKRLIALPDLNPIPRTARRQEDGYVISAADLMDACRAWEFVAQDTEEDY